MYIIFSILYVRYLKLIGICYLLQFVLPNKLNNYIISILMLQYSDCDKGNLFSSQAVQKLNKPDDHGIPY